MYLECPISSNCNFISVAEQNSFFPYSVQVKARKIFLKSHSTILDCDRCRAFEGFGKRLLLTIRSQNVMVQVAQKNVVDFPCFAGTACQHMPKNLNWEGTLKIL